MSYSRIFSLGIVLVLIVGAIYYLNQSSSHPTVVAPVVEITTPSEVATSTPATLEVGSAVSSTQSAVASQHFLSLAEKKAQYGRAKELSQPGAFINTPGDAPITIQSLVGKKVILVDFWTYSCINCQRTQPYLNAWYSKYKDQGLEIIGVHSPEFDFERDANNVRLATKAAGIEYPVVQDNDFATWQAYANRFWPHKYLIDVDGFIVYDHIGEGSYDETEKEIQKLLTELHSRTGVGAVAGGLVTPITPVVQAGSPETYFGSNRNEYLGNGNKGTAGTQTFTLPSSFTLNTLYLGGTWNLTSEYAEAKKESRVHYRFKSKNVYLVASSPSQAVLSITLDGVKQNSVTVSTDRLYTLISLPVAGEHELEFTVPIGVKLYAFTFG